MENLPMDVIGLIKQFHSNKIFIARCVYKDHHDNLTESDIEFISTDLKETYNYCLTVALMEKVYWTISEYTLGPVFPQNLKACIIIDTKLLRYQKDELEYQSFPLTYKEGKIYSDQWDDPQYGRDPMGAKEIRLE
jgi:hypothetical protein